MNDNIEKLNAKITGEVLYDNASGNNANVILSKSVANYSRIEIFYRSNDNAYDSLVVSNPNGKTISLVSNYVNMNTPYLYLKFALYDISGNNISVKNYCESRIGAGIATTCDVGSNRMFICTVIGYK